MTAARLDAIPGPLATHVVRRRSDGACFPARIEGDAMLVEYQGAWIPAATLPDPGRCRIATLDGWYHTRTGGGCTALRLDLEPVPADDGDPPLPAYALLTDAEDTQAAPEDLSRSLLIGFYVDGDQGDSFEGPLADCLAWLDRVNVGAT